MSDNKITAIQSLVPTTFEQVDALAKRLAESSLLPKALKDKPADVAIVILTGLEFGLGVMAAIRGINIIEGKAVLSADLTSALVQRHRDVCEYLSLVKSTDTEATYETQRHGHKHPISLSYTIAQASKAGLTKKDNWVKNPSDMLRARCVSKLCRAVYPDLVQGVYNEDEAEEIAENARIASGEVIDVTGGGALDYDSMAQSILDRINTAHMVEQLQELVPEIRRLPKDYQRRIHTPYKEREGAIQRGEVREDDLPAFEPSQPPAEGPAQPDGTV